MYEIPSRIDVRKCVISADTVLQGKTPLLLTRSERVVEMDDQAEASA